MVTLRVVLLMVLLGVSTGLDAQDPTFIVDMPTMIPTWARPTVVEPTTTAPTTTTPTATDPVFVPTSSPSLEAFSAPDKAAVDDVLPTIPSIADDMSARLTVRTTDDPTTLPDSDPTPTPSEEPMRLPAPLSDVAFVQPVTQVPADDGSSIAIPIEAPPSPTQPRPTEPPPIAGSTTNEPPPSPILPLSPSETTVAPSPPSTTSSSVEDDSSPSPIPATMAPASVSVPAVVGTLPVEPGPRPADLPTGTVVPPLELSPEFNLIPVLASPQDARPTVHGPGTASFTDVVTTTTKPVEIKATGSASHATEGSETNAGSGSHAADSTHAPFDRAVLSNLPPSAATDSSAAGLVTLSPASEALTAVNRLTTGSAETESADWNVALVVSLFGACGLIIGVLLAVEIYLRRSRRRHIKQCEIQQPIMII